MSGRIIPTNCVSCSSTACQTAYGPEYKVVGETKGICGSGKCLYQCKHSSYLAKPGDCCKGQMTLTKGHTCNPIHYPGTSFCKTTYPSTPLRSVIAPMKSPISNNAAPGPGPAPAIPDSAPAPAPAPGSTSSAPQNDRLSGDSAAGTDSPSAGTYRAAIETITPPTNNYTIYIILFMMLIILAVMTVIYAYKIKALKSQASTIM